MTLQRRHLYVPADSIAAARANLIQALAKGEMSIYDEARKKYEVDDVIKMSESSDIIPRNVRVLELIYPSRASQVLGDGALYPLIETQHYFLEPLLSLLNDGQIQLPRFDDLAAHHKSQTESDTVCAWLRSVCCNLWKSALTLAPTTALVNY